MFVYRHICFLFANILYFFCFTAKITLHIKEVSEEERWQAKPAAKERKAKEMRGEFPGIHIISSVGYVL